MEKKVGPKIMLSGGGTGGSVTPLLAVAAELFQEESEIEILFVGSQSGPEKELVENFSDKGRIKFITISAGKWRRYFSFHNLIDIFKIGLAFFESLKILRQEQPDIVMSAGSFVSVPLVWAAAVKRIPILIHQQDIRPGLANRLMAPFARVVTISFEKSFADYGPRAVWTGNPLRDLTGYQDNVALTREKYGLASNQPLVLVLGGGTGALGINRLIAEIKSKLVDVCQTVHLTGKGKGVEIVNSDNYQAWEFLPQEEVLSLMASADLVVSRAGLGALTELIGLAKPTILIPMPNSHQEDNAIVFRDNHAALVLDQNTLTGEDLLKEITGLLSDADKRRQLSVNIARLLKSRAAENIAALVWEIVGPKEKR